MERNKGQAIRRRVKMREIGEMAQWYRQKAGIRVQDLVGRTGYSSGLIYSFENGKTANLLILFDCYLSVLPEPFKTRFFDDIVRALK